MTDLLDAVLIAAGVVAVTTIGLLLYFDDRLDDLD